MKSNIYIIRDYITYENIDFCFTGLGTHTKRLINLIKDYIT